MDKRVIKIVIIYYRICIRIYGFINNKSPDNESTIFKET